MKITKTLFGLLLITVVSTPVMSSAMTQQEMRATLLSVAQVLDTMSAQIISSKESGTAIAQLSDPDSTLSAMDVNQDGDVTRDDVFQVNGTILDYSSSGQYSVIEDLNQDRMNNPADFFIIKNYLVDQGNLLVQFDVNLDGEIALDDLAFLEMLIPFGNAYYIYGDLDQNEINDLSDFKMLYIYLDSAGFDVSGFDGVLDLLTPADLQPTNSAQLVDDRSELWKHIEELRATLANLQAAR